MTGSGEENDKDGRRAEDKKLLSLLTERVPRTSRASGAKGVRYLVPKSFDTRYC